MIADLPAIISGLFEASLGVAVLIGVVLVLRRPIARHFGPHAAYALWLLPLIRLAMPPLPVLEPTEAAVQPLPVASEYVVYTETTLPRVGVEPIMVARPAAVSPSTERSAAAPAAHDRFAFMPGINEVMSALGVLWAAGAVIYLLLLITRQIRFSDHAWRNTVEPTPALRSQTRALKAQLGIKRPVAIKACPFNDGPLVCGLIHPLIVVPEDFSRRFAPSEQTFALTHELMHVKRGDLAASLAMTLIRATQWWNPLGRHAVHAFRADQEAACDADVLRRTGARRHDYASTLVKAVRTNAEPIPALTLDHGLKQRLAQMQRPNALKGGSAVVAIVATLGLGATASYAVQERSEDELASGLERALAPTAPSPAPSEVAEPRPEPAPRFEQDERRLAAQERRIEAEERRLVAISARSEAENERLEALREEVEARSEALADLAAEMSDAAVDGDRRRLAGLERQMDRQQSDLERAVAELKESQAYQYSVRRLPTAQALKGFSLRNAGGSHFVFATDGTELSFGQEDGILVLSDPMAGLHAELGEVAAAAMPAMDFDIPAPEVPTVTAVKIITADGEEIEVPNIEVLIPSRMPDVEAYAAKVRTEIERSEINSRVKFALDENGFSERIRDVATTLRALKERCENHQSQSDRPKVLRRMAAEAGTEQVVLCFSGGRSALQSEELADFVANSRGLSDSQKERFSEFKSGVNFSFTYSVAE
jgi:beta-lactamase regulating signal transducer with metallopeptidase domain